MRIFLSKEFMKNIKKIPKPSSWNGSRILDSDGSCYFFSRNLSLKPATMYCQSCFYFIFRLKYVATLLPIRTVGVQGDARSYSYAVAISCSKEQLGAQEWTDMLYFAKLIPRVCHNINRVTYVFGKFFDCNSTRSYR